MQPLSVTKNKPLHKSQTHSVGVGRCASAMCDELSVQCSSFDAKTTAFETNVMAPKKKIRLDEKDNDIELEKPINQDSIHSPTSSSYSLNDFFDPLQNDEMSDDVEQCDDMYQKYRQECELLLQSAATYDREAYVSILQNMVHQLIEQNQILVENLVQIKRESAQRVQQMRQKLHTSAARTEEVMLALATHELYLKQFARRHCCSCCGCDLRLMQFKVCHGAANCNTNTESEQFCQTKNQCANFGLPWRSVFEQTSSWLARSHIGQLNCLHDIPSQIRFTTLVDRIDTRIHQLEAENEEIKQENSLIRELNSLLSGRNGGANMRVTEHNAVLCSSKPKEKANKPFYLSTNRSTNDDSLTSFQEEKSIPNEELITFVSGSLHDEFDDPFSGYLEDSLELRDSFDSSYTASRSDSLNGRLDNDSGCSTDLIPSQTDINSLLLSDCEDDPEDLVKTVLSHMRLVDGTCSSKEGDFSSDDSVSSEQNEIDLLRNRLALAKKLVPKLYSKMIYYLVQKNILLRQFQLESQARRKCKQELTSIAESLTIDLKDIVLNTKAIKQLQLCPTSDSSQHY